MLSPEVARNIQEISTNSRARARLLGVARRILADDPHEAEDAIQDGIVQALSSSAAFRGDANPATWMHRVVVNAAVMRRRKALRANRLDRPELAMQQRDWAAGGGRATGPDVEAEQREQLELARRALATLGDDYRDAVERCVLADRSPDEVARELGVSPSCLRTRTARARRQLASAVAA